MTHDPPCPRCGVLLAADAPEGLCARCLSELALLELEGERAVEPAGLRERLARALPDCELGRFLGRGGMGVVFQARQRTLERTVAIKVVAPASAAPWVERFTREARALARLDHPNIVRVFDFGSADGLAYLVLEFVDGANLRELLDGGKLEPAEALAIVPQLCDALQYAHERGVVHRDVKPENILIDTEGRVKLADFGLAKLVEPHDVAFTASGTTLGTLRYMAPEQMDAPGSVDHRADVFSLGVVLYEMLTGRVPAGHFERPSELVRIDVRLDEVVLRALRREPAQRYQRVSEFEEELARVASAPPAPEAQPPAFVHRAPRASRRRTARWLVSSPQLDLTLCGLGIFVSLGLAHEASMRAADGESASPTLALLPILWFCGPIYALWRAGWRAETREHQRVRTATGAFVFYTSPSEWIRAIGLLLIGLGWWGLVEPPQTRFAVDPEPIPLRDRLPTLANALHLAGATCLLFKWGERREVFDPALNVFSYVDGDDFGAAAIVAYVLALGWLVRQLLFALERQRAGGVATAITGACVFLFTLMRMRDAFPAAGAWLALIAGGALALTGSAECFLAGSRSMRSRATLG